MLGVENPRGSATGSSDTTIRFQPDTCDPDCWACWGLAGEVADTRKQAKLPPPPSPSPPPHLLFGASHHMMQIPLRALFRACVIMSQRMCRKIIHQQIIQLHGQMLGSSKCLVSCFLPSPAPSERRSAASYALAAASRGRKPENRRLRCANQAILRLDMSTFVEIGLVCFPSIQTLHQGIELHLDMQNAVRLCSCTTRMGTGGGRVSRFVGS